MRDDFYPTHHWAEDTLYPWLQRHGMCHAHVYVSDNSNMISLQEMFIYFTNDNYRCNHKLLVGINTPEHCEDLVYIHLYVLLFKVGKRRKDAVHRRSKFNT